MNKIRFIHFSFYFFNSFTFFGFNRFLNLSFFSFIIFAFSCHALILKPFTDHALSLLSIKTFTPQNQLL